MTDRISALPADEQCCAEALRDCGIPSVRAGFAQHCVGHGLEADRYATLWTQELLVEAALGFITAAREGGNAQFATLEQFVGAAKVAWHEARGRRGRAQ